MLWSIYVDTIWYNVFTFLSVVTLISSCVYEYKLILLLSPSPCLFSFSPFFSYINIGYVTVLARSLLPSIFFCMLSLLLYKHLCNILMVAFLRFVVSIDGDPNGIPRYMCSDLPYSGWIMPLSWTSSFFSVNFSSFFWD